jgi:hypothetical protein
VIRYADVLLMRAEALIQLNDGRITDAISLINEVRSRAAGSSIAGSQCTGGDTGHGSGSGDLQKAFTRDLVHAWMILSSLFLFLFFDFPLIRNAPPQYGADFVR